MESLRGMGEVVASPQFAQRGLFRHIPHPTHGTIKVPGVPWRGAAPLARWTGTRTQADMARLKVDGVIA